jgi:hypothetical protein
MESASRTPLIHRAYRYDHGYRAFAASVHLPASALPRRGPTLEDGGCLFRSASCLYGSQPLLRPSMGCVLSGLPSESLMVLDVEVISVWDALE